ncbi:hypothetical protein [Shewanella surugensis]|uniref:Uncharacterized protein n=1 Tax=Shewanella surugensis TaxID=212020 RepID=A0ABT0LIE7_9GAMM|nr:hypothetical protein [Shewanella surugensis]MCL1126906.1 hypothetical protein [Shewanella surugensis]
MSIFNGPRINFWGGISTNVNVANNSNDVPQSAEPEDQQPILDVASAQIADQAASMTDADIIALMRGPDPQHYYTESGWNFYGDQQLHLVDAQVSSSGSPGAVNTQGGIVNEPIYLLGSVDPITGEGPHASAVMVDLDPTAAIVTQIIMGGLMIGSPDKPKLHLVENVTADSYGVFTVAAKGDNETEQGLITRQFYRDPDGPGSAWASGTFQVTFSKASIKSADMSDPAIAALINDVNMDGIVLRFQMFEMFPMLTTDELLLAYKNNRNPSNPSYGRIVGTLAPHYPGEPKICSIGREVVMQETQLVGYFDIDQEAERLTLDALSLYPKAHFRDNRKNIGANFPIEPNVDYGINTLTAGDVSLTFSANPDDYYRYGGIIDIELKSTSATDTVSHSPVEIKGEKPVTLTAIGDQIRIDPTNENHVSSKAMETAFKAIETPVRIYGDARNIYIDEHDGAMNIELNVRIFGRPTPIFDEPGGNLHITLASGNTGALADGNFLDFPQQTYVQQGKSHFTFSITDKGNIDQYGFQTLVISSVEGGSHFINVRKYPKTDFGIVVGSSISWEQAYNNALRYFYVTFPAMNMRFPLNDEMTVKNLSGPIQSRISDEYRQTSLYMPITRSMTPSQRALLTQFLNNQPWAPLTGSQTISSADRGDTTQPPH